MNWTTFFSEIWHRVVRYKSTYISKELIASILRYQELAEELVRSE
jgi:hypothetical protein